MHPTPQDVTEHQSLFKARVLFNQPENAMIISRNDFDRPVLLANRELLDILLPVAENSLQQMCQSDSWADKVRREIRSLLVRGEVPDADTVSANLAVGLRSLQMKLQKEQTSFQQLLDALRKESAIKYLKDSEVPICDIALILGFSEQSAFNHAFKRWTGMSPGEFRKESSMQKKA